MDYVILKTGGKQYRVSEGEELVIEKVPQEGGKKVVFDQVLLVKKGEKVFLGQPLVKQAKVEAEVLSQFKDKKIRVAKFRAKSRYRKVKGHRQLLTKVKIEKIKYGQNQS